MGSGSRAGSHCKEEESQRGQDLMTKTDLDKRRDGGNTHRYICVLVENDLEEVRREYGRGFKVLLGSADVLFLPIWTRRRTRQICQSRSDHSEDSDSELAFF